MITPPSNIDDFLFQLRNPSNMDKFEQFSGFPELGKRLLGENWRSRLHYLGFLLSAYLQNNLDAAKPLLDLFLKYQNHPALAKSAAIVLAGNLVSFRGSYEFRDLQQRARGVPLNLTVHDLREGKFYSSDGEYLIEVVELDKAMVTYDEYSFKEYNQRETRTVLKKQLVDRLVAGKFKDVSNALALAS
ncbi:MAG: hypothetical protein COT74_03105 [Bdellovibrionales bacterium CG10_big_fil_rev_8_21_14_0_10_45_34]|nr:MAG: hypothetical protein COT74_03105 [Bdellovibrionales bacterium CG10_big_fil_rev_8_21_14_0_10_45_34]